METMSETKQLNVTVPLRLHTELAVVSAATGVPIKVLAREAIEEALNRRHPNGRAIVAGLATTQAVAS
jgi:predicted HicB family RNase H-like nuclease